VALTEIGSTGIQTGGDAAIDLEDVSIDGAQAAAIALSAAPAATGEGMLLAKMNRVLLTNAVGTALCINGVGRVEAENISIAGTHGVWDFCFDMEHHHALAQGVLVESRSRLTLSGFDIAGVESSTVAEGIASFSPNLELADGVIRGNAVGLHVFGPFRPQDHLSGVVLDNAVNYEVTLVGQ
jgi:hypothetical protein